MKGLHWLKIPECIQFNILVTIYQCANGVAPSFVIDLLQADNTYILKGMSQKHKEE